MTPTTMPILWCSLSIRSTRTWRISESGGNNEFAVDWATAQGNKTIAASDKMGGSFFMVTPFEPADGTIKAHPSYLCG